MCDLGISQNLFKENNLVGHVVSPNKTDYSGYTMA